MFSNMGGSAARSFHCGLKVARLRAVSRSFPSLGDSGSRIGATRRGGAWGSSPQVLSRMTRVPIQIIAPEKASTANRPFQVKCTGQSLGGATQSNIIATIRITAIKYAMTPSRLEGGTLYTGLHSAQTRRGVSAISLS